MPNKYWHRNKWWSKGSDGFIELRTVKDGPVAVAVVDMEDLYMCLNKKWRLNSTGNVVCGGSKNKEIQTLGRFILGIASLKDTIDNSYFVICSDGDPLNNRKSNLNYGKNINQHSKKE